MKTFRSLFGFVIAMLVVLFAATGADASQLLRFNITLGDSKPGVPTSHTFQFTHPTNDTLRQVQFEYCTTPSGTCTSPNTLSTSGATKGTFTGLVAAEWSLNSPQPNRIVIHHVGNGHAVGANLEVSLGFQNIQNQSITACEPSNTSSDSCYVRVDTCNNLTCDNSTMDGIVDQGIGSVTVVRAVEVKARVDPIFSFRVSGVPADQTHNGITTSVASTFNNLNFGNLTAGIPRYTAHRLNVTTNTENGYAVRMVMNTPMTGVYAANNIDPFSVGTWGTPTYWTAPTGTSPSVNTGWIGANTTDSDITGWDSTPSQKFGPVSGTQQIVMQGSGSDNGTGAVYVTYGIEANVFQPADTYTGELLYFALPTY
jgi:hypothetical protein